MPDSRLCVEFLGIPGAGKSAVSTRVVLILEEKGFRVDDLSYRLAHGRRRWSRFLMKSVHVAQEVAFHPLLTMKALWEIAAVRHPSPRVLSKMIFNWLLVSALARRGRTLGIHVYDQGIFQAFWSIGLGGGEEVVEKIAGRLWGLTPAPDLVVVIEADLPAILHRLKMRHERKSRIDRLFKSHPEVLEECARILTSTTKTLDAIREREPSMGCVVLRCQTADDLDSESRRLAALIEVQLAQRILKRTSLVPERPREACAPPTRSRWPA